MGEDTSSPFPSSPTQGFATSRCAVDRSGSNSAYVPLRTKSSSVTVRGDRAVLSGIMQIVTSAVRVFLYVMPLDILSLSLSVSFSTKEVGQKRTIGMPRCWDGPASLDFSDSNIVQFVGNGCALRHCRRVPLPGEVRQRRRGGEGDRCPSSCSLADMASTRAARCNVLVDASLSFGHRASAARQSYNRNTVLDWLTVSGMKCCSIVQQVWMEPFDFKSPEVETLVLSRFPCPPLQPRSRCGGSQADGVWDGTLLVQYALRKECVANEALSTHAATGPCRGGDGPFPV